MKSQMFSRFARAIDFYRDKDYTYIETPYAVDIKYITMTAPNGYKPFPLMNESECLVGSAEQSFLSIYNRLTPNKKYQSFTTCFRSDNIDSTHKRWFYKLELFTPSEKYDDSLIMDAFRYFSNFVNAQVIKTDIGYDIIDYNSKLELGSYGFREVNNMKWTYGTGLAEPRLTIAMNAQG